MNFLAFFGFASLLASAIASITNGIVSHSDNKKALKQQKEMQETIFNREDSSYQRTVEDMQKAGLSPLGMGSTNNAGSVVSASNFKLDNPFGQISQDFANIGNSATSLALQERARLDNLNHQKELLNWEKLKYNNDASFRNETLNKLKEEINGMQLDNKAKKQVFEELERLNIPLVQYEKGMPEVTQTRIATGELKQAVNDMSEVMEDENPAHEETPFESYSKPNTREHTVFIRTKDKLVNSHQRQLLANYLANEQYANTPMYSRKTLSGLYEFLEAVDKQGVANDNGKVSESKVKSLMSQYLNKAELNALESIMSNSENYTKYKYNSQFRYFN